jgi:hypothetical protein
MQTKLAQQNKIQTPIKNSNILVLISQYLHNWNKP